MLDLTKPRYDVSTYTGRCKHFLLVTNPLNVLATPAQLDEAARVVKGYKATGEMPAGYDEEKLWRAKYLYDSAYHPDTGEKMLLIGRMSAQVPMNTLITGCMITFYKTTRSTIFWQWTNQTFNAIVNYTNRSGSSPISPQQLGVSYVAATGGALATALYLNSLTRRMSPVWARLVPFAAVAGANFINIPMMRSSELMSGTPVFTETGEYVGDSKKAAMKGISLVVISRVFMATPGMILAPLLTNAAVNRGLFKTRPKMLLPFQLTIVAFCLTFATPMCCALFDQNSTLSTSDLEEEVKENYGKPLGKEVYFNKGL